MLYKRRLTQLDGKMGPALRVAYRDVGSTIPWMESVESSLEQRPRATQGAVAEGCGSFAPEKAPLCVACMDGKDCSRQSYCISTIHGGHSQGREQDAVSFARCSFGTTTKSPGAILRVSPEGVRHRDVSNKQRASRLAYRDVGKGRENGCGSFDWHFFRGNINTKLVLTGPSYATSY